MRRQTEYVNLLIHQNDEGKFYGVHSVMLENGEIIDYTTSSFALAQDAFNAVVRFIDRRSAPSMTHYRCRPQYRITEKVPHYNDRDGIEFWTIETRGYANTNDGARAALRVLYSEYKDCEAPEFSFERIDGKVLQMKVCWNDAWAMKFDPMPF